MITLSLFSLVWVYTPKLKNKCIKIVIQINSRSLFPITLFHEHFAHSVNHIVVEGVPAPNVPRTQGEGGGGGYRQTR